MGVTLGGSGLTMPGYLADEVEAVAARDGDRGEAVPKVMNADIVESSHVAKRRRIGRPSISRGPEMHPRGCHAVARCRHAWDNLSDYPPKALIRLVRTAGLEPALPYEKQILSLLRLPFRHVRYALAAEPDIWVRAVAGR